MQLYAFDRIAATVTFITINDDNEAEVVTDTAILRHPTLSATLDDTTDTAEDYLITNPEAADLTREYLMNTRGYNGKYTPLLITKISYDDCEVYKIEPEYERD